MLQMIANTFPNRAQHYLDHMKVQRISQLPDLKERCGKLLPFFQRRLCWGMKDEVHDGLLSCGDIAGEMLLAHFDDPQYSMLRFTMIRFWGQSRYHKAVPLLIKLLLQLDDYWATQNLEKDLSELELNPELFKTFQQKSSEMYCAVSTLEQFNDPSARDALTRTLHRWQNKNSVYHQTAEECTRALKALDEVEK